MKYLLLLLLLLLPIYVYSIDSSDLDLWKNKRQFTPTKSLAMAGAQNIGANKTDAAYLNPATLITKDKKYMMSLDTQYSNSEIPTQFMISAVDSRTSVVAGGAYVSYYDYNKKENSKTVNYNALQVGLSYAYPIAGGLVLGIAGRYYKYKKDDKNYIHTATFDLGMTYRFSPYVKIGVVGYNLTNLDYIETPMSVVSGFSIGDDDIFLLNFDFVANFSAPDIYDKSGSAAYEYHTGIQVTPVEGFSVLAGYEVNKVLDENFWSLGTEIFIPESRVELTGAYLQSTSKKSNKYFSFSLRLYF